MANLNHTTLDPAFWQGKRVFLTGHTGFKGAWLSILLHDLGAEVIGYSLAPETDPALFDLLALDQLIQSSFGDIRDAEKLRKALLDSKPDIALHFAAQPIVSEGYRDPSGTFATNVIGVVNFLEACREIDKNLPILVISSDKCYRNDDTGRAFMIDDPLGGKDPYSASKACTEIVVGSYIQSFFDIGSGPSLASARAGNVIGGGDWSVDRLFPDGARAFASNQPLTLRNPLATRPWQHVIEPIYGYLVLVQEMAKDRTFAGAWNFGPADRNHQPVGKMASLFAKTWGFDAKVEISGDKQSWTEAAKLDLDCTITNNQLGWWPVLSLSQTVGWTADWYRSVMENPSVDVVRAITRDQIEQYLLLQTKGNG